MPMLYGRIAGIDRPVSRLVLGTGDFSPERQDLAVELLDTFVAAGGNLVDTAHMYGGGGSERALGEWLRRRRNRDDALVLTKGAHFGRDGVPRVHPAETAFDLGQSLERLGIGSVDLYLLHRDDPETPVGPIVEALNDHAARGRIRAFGASNWAPARLQAANEYAAAHGLVPFAAGSPQFSLAVPREPMWPGCLTVSGDAEALAWYRRQQFPLLAWSSQATGYFSGRFGPAAHPDADMARVYDDAANWERLRRAEQLAGRRGVSATQIALAWVLNQPGLNVFAIVGPHTTAELEASLAATGITLTPGEVAWLNLESDTQPPW